MGELSYLEKRIEFLELVHNLDCQTIKILLQNEKHMLDYNEWAINEISRLRKLLDADKTITV